MRFNPEASWGANAGLDVPRKALEDVKVCLSSAWDDFVGFSRGHCNLSPTIVSVLLCFFSFSCCTQSKFPEISYADLYTLAGVVAVEEAG